MKLNLGYITFPSKAEAKKAVLGLLGEGLIACANILPNGESFFIWDDEIQNAAETVVIFKAKSKNAEAIIKRVREMHSYTCPCIVFLPIENGNPDYLRWIESIG